jgi:nitroimidazol reductase NimA-like FMN-containing flavoprotein (pyridoxamine 5'-phosphate oxidase superfamily)
MEDRLGSVDVTRLVDVAREDCVALLKSAQVGRVVYTDGALPVCTPVTYTMYGRAIVFRTTTSARITRAVQDSVVAFEVDDFDVDRRTGWSVLATGTATAVHDSSTLLRLEQTGLASWAGSDRTEWIRIVPTLLSGRRLVDRAEPSAA